ncbi:hypothetical protein COV82_04815 [Candidatus Peregrinibacteria bacterium CG11_big_fil_rev_8_21_14_0_20_46_8]|nr:MAG: hypothetical protein COV82_04815 [Candidatus Peregrinibacteria bacterium CG11_big_fil_rev_8_21_14_0_20_46_8]
MKNSSNILPTAGALLIIGGGGIGTTLFADNQDRFQTNSIVCGALQTGEKITLPGLWQRILEIAEQTGKDITTVSGLQEYCELQTNPEIDFFHWMPVGGKTDRIIRPTENCIALSLQHVPQEIQRRPEIAALIMDAKKISPALPADCR